MVKTFVQVAVLLLMVCIASLAAAETQWKFGMSGGSEGISGFYFSVGNYYHVPEREVIVIRERGIPDEELPVVFFICRHARVSPDVIIKLRSRGLSWYDITIHLGLTPEIYYVPVVIHKGGPPYGHAYGYYKKHPRGKWSKIKLTDADIVNQVNLDFVSKHYGYDPAQVIRMREHGTSFVNIERKVYRAKGGKENYQGEESRSKGESDKGWKEKEWKGDRIPPGQRKKMKD